MEQYQTLESGHFQLGNKTIPDDMGVVERRQMQAKVDAGQAVILPYVAPPLPAIDDIVLTPLERLELLETENPVPPGKIRAKKQAKRDAGRA